MKKLKIRQNYILLMTIVIVVAVVAYSLGKLQYNTATQSNSLEKDNQQKELLLLGFKPVVAQGVTEDEQKQIEKTVDTFEGYKFQKDADRLLAMFTLPQTREEQDTLDSILGKDYTQGSAKPLSRLFSTQGYNHSVGGHYTRSIKKQGNSIIAAVDELRIFYRGLSEDFVGYSAKVSNLTLELEKSGSGYRITRYYHTNPNSSVLKYEGFLAE